MSNVLMCGELSGAMLLRMLPALVEQIKNEERYVFNIRKAEPLYTWAEICEALLDGNSGLSDATDLVDMQRAEVSV